MKVNNFSFMRRVMCIVLFFSLLLSGITVTAIDYNPPRYPKDIKFHTYMKKMVACMTYNWSNVKDEIYRQRLRDAIGDWEWMDNGHVSLSEVSSASNAYLIAYDSWASHLSTTALGVNEATLTKNQNLYNYYLSGSSLGGPSSISSVTKIQQCKIRVNKAKTDAWKNDKEWWHDIQAIWSHEIGHALGLPDLDMNYVSIMEGGRPSKRGWDDFWKPQASDTANLERFNYKSWNSSNVPTME